MDNYSLNPKKYKAAIRKFEGVSNKKIAEELGVSAQTMTKWMGEDEIRSLIADLNNERMKEARNKFRAILPVCLDSLEEIIKSSKSDNAKVNAIKLVLDHAKLANSNNGLWDVTLTTNMLDLP